MCDGRSGSSSGWEYVGWLTDVEEEAEKQAETGDGPSFQRSTHIFASGASSPKGSIAFKIALFIFKKITI